MEKKGYSRRDFLQFCACGRSGGRVLGRSGVAQVVSAFEKKEKPAVVWMHFQECTCCSESFIRASHPIVADALLDVLSLNYTETLMAASGFQAEKSLHDTIKNNKGKYIVLVEGAVPTKDGGVYCMIGGKTAESILQEVSARMRRPWWHGAVALRTAACRRPSPIPPGATPIHKLVNKPVINVPGCPPIADVMMGVVTHLLVLGQIPALDSLGRPKEFYGRRVHDTCYRRANYDAGPVRGVVGRRERAQGILPLQDGLQGTGDLQRLLGGEVERGHQLSNPVGPWVHRVQRRGLLGQRPASISICPASPALVSRARPTPLAPPWELTTLAGVAAHAVVTNVRKKQVIAEVHAEDQKES